MTRRKVHFHRSRISDRKLRHLLECFVFDIGATQTAKMTGLNRNTVNRYFHIVRQKIAAYCETVTPLRGSVEADESYFGGKKKGGKRGRGAAHKVPVFGVLKRGGSVYTQIITNANKAQIRPIIKRMVTKGEYGLHRRMACLPRSHCGWLQALPYQSFRDLWHRT